MGSLCSKIQCKMLWNRKVISFNKIISNKPCMQEHTNKHQGMQKSRLARITWAWHGVQATLSTQLSHILIYFWLDAIYWLGIVLFIILHCGHSLGSCTSVTCRTPYKPWANCPRLIILLFSYTCILRPQTSHFDIVNISGFFFLPSSHMNVTMYSVL